MKTITEYIYLTEAWANTKNYKRELDDLLDKYKKKKEAEEKKAAKGKLGWRPSYKYPSEVLAKYPNLFVPNVATPLTNVVSGL